MGTCTNCGQPLTDRAMFCGNCGAPVHPSQPVYGYPSGAYPAQPSASGPPYPGQGTGQWSPPGNRGVPTGAIVAAALAVVAVISIVVFLNRDRTKEAGGTSPTTFRTTDVVVTYAPSTPPTTSPPQLIQYWVDTFQDAPGFSTPGGVQTGTLYKGTHYVYCKVWGPWVGRSETVYNHWWLLTDLDVGSPRTNQYVSAYFLSHWGNDEARDNYGTTIPDC